jgi:RimJ/RimL family protein N-acetyltransferase
LTTLSTARLRLEPFEQGHLQGLHEMNKRAKVMRFISGQAETLEQTQAGIERVRRRWAEWGHSWWAFIDIGSREVVGAGCIQHLGHEAMNPLEIGWRLHPKHWGRGLATEAAVEMARFAFEERGAPLLTAVRHPDNLASAQVMDRMHMRYRGMESWYDRLLAVHELSRERWTTRTPQDLLG